MLLSAAVFGLCHIYQGMLGAFLVGLIGLMFAIAYAWFGRIWPLVIGHALFDSLQILLAVILVSRGAG